MRDGKTFRLSFVFCIPRYCVFVMGQINREAMFVKKRRREIKSQDSVRHRKEKFSFYPKPHSTPHLFAEKSIKTLHFQGQLNLLLRG